MSLPTQTKQWQLSHKPTTAPVLKGDDATYKFVTKEVPELKDGEVLGQALYLSNDPTQRAWIAAQADPERMYVPPVAIGEVMRAMGVMKVIESKSDKFAKGSLVTGPAGWTEYTVLPANRLQQVPEVSGISPTHFLGALGPTGLTAWYGLVEIIGAKKGETLVVSGAAGATGSMVVQIAKHLVGCSKVIGIAGSEEKCRWVESLGADACINYKKSDWKDALGKATDGFVDMYFDNVGGEQLDFMLTRLKTYGRVAACGAISSYNDADHGAIKLQNYSNIIIQRLQVKGFIILDFYKTAEASATIKKLTEAAVSGKIKIGDENETVVESKFEDIPKTWMRLFEGSNRGKLVTKLV